MSGRKRPGKARENLRNEKVLIRMTKEELKAVKGNAKNFCRGNVSKWMRTRALNPMLDVSIEMQNKTDGELFKHEDDHDHPDAKLPVSS